MSDLQGLCILPRVLVGVSRRAHVVAYGCFGRTSGRRGTHPNIFVTEAPGPYRPVEVPMLSAVYLGFVSTS